MKPEFKNIENRAEADKLVGEMYRLYGKHDLGKLAIEVSKELGSWRLATLARTTILIVVNFGIYLFYVLFASNDGGENIEQYILLAAVAVSIGIIWWLVDVLVDQSSVYKFLLAYDNFNEDNVKEIRPKAWSGQFLSDLANMIFSIPFWGFIGVSWFYWIKTGWGLGSLVMIVLGLVPVTAPFAALVGVYILFVEIPDWVFRFFG